MKGKEVRKQEHILLKFTNLPPKTKYLCEKKNENIEQFAYRKRLRTLWSCNIC